MESMGGGQVLGAARITWLKDSEETIEVARKSGGNCLATIVRRRVTESYGGGNVLQVQV
jgi:hypothetical protein